jgi:hypothetical protein
MQSNRSSFSTVSARCGSQCMSLGSPRSDCDGMNDTATPCGPIRRRAAPCISSAGPTGSTCPSAGVGSYQSWHHSQTLPCMSNSPRRFGRSDATGPGRVSRCRPRTAPVRGRRQTRRASPHPPGRPAPTPLPPAADTHPTASGSTARLLPHHPHRRLVGAALHVDRLSLACVMLPLSPRQPRGRPRRTAASAARVALVAVPIAFGFG